MASPVLPFSCSPGTDQSDRLKLTSNEVIKLAFAAGYRVTDDGQLISKTGRPRRMALYGGRYPMITIRVGGKGVGCSVHRLAAYCFFGDAMFAPGIQVRHLNSNRLDISRVNIALGTCRENHLDKPVEQRREAALKGARTRVERGIVPASAVFSAEDVDQIRTRRTSGESCAEIAADLGCGAYTVRSIVAGKSYSWLAPRTATSPRLSASENGEIIEAMFRRGMRISEICSQCCCKSHDVRTELENRGVLPSLAGLTDERLSETYLSAPFPSASKIAADYATDAHVILGRLKKAGISIRPRGEQVRIEIAHGRMPKPPNRWIAAVRQKLGLPDVWEGDDE